MELKAVCVMAAGLSLATAVLAGDALAANSPKLLPSGGLRKILHSGKLHIKAVVYGSSGEIKDDAFEIKPHAGMHYTTVKVGLKNIGTSVYARDLTTALAVTNDHGAVSHAVALGKHGLGKVVLKKDATAYGRVFFELRDNTRIHTVRFRAFDDAPTVSVFAVRGSGAKETAASTKPLPAGGTRKIVRSGSSVLRAVLYGVGGGVEGRAIGAKPHAGSHFIALKVGLANLGSKPYTGNLALLTSITSTKGKTSRAVPSAGIAKISLAPSHTIKGRVFFEVKDESRLSKFRFRPFGPNGKLAVFVVRKG